jgi:uncharacterized tellurite resistance protein B-like protein
MKSKEFKEFLFKSAVMAMSCDGNISQAEIDEIRKIVASEIYFIDYEYENPLKNYIDYIKYNGKNAVSEYLKEVGKSELSEKQEILLIEVVLRIIEADNNIYETERKFLQMVIKNLKIDEQTLIIKFPKQIDSLLGLTSHNFHQEFPDKIKVV